MHFSEADKKLLLFLSSKPSKSSTILTISAEFRVSPDTLRVSVEELSGEGMLKKENKISTLYSYTSEGSEAQKSGLPEVKILKALASKTPSEAPLSSLNENEKKFGLPHALKQGWVKIQSKILKLTEKGKIAFEKRQYFFFPPNPQQLSSLDNSTLSSFVHRGLLKKTEKVQDTLLTLTKKGASTASTLTSLPSEKLIGTLDRKTLLSGSWKNKKLAKYNISAPLSEKIAARRHPISRLREHICNIFAQMGFEQMDGPLIDSAFWNFDSLFQPQDHPARDLADTFYLNEKTSLPEKTLVSRVSSAHKKGWEYEWSESDACQQVLRTHTTSVSARTLFENANNPPPRKFFSVGKVFRNEATDYKHLAEFFQVEGIIAWENATFPHLLGTLKQFYSKLGFEKIRFRPSYFPYTEPSLEVEVFHNKRKEWIELGGAGIFRPEVSEPICNKFPVLAWGLSLERPLMLSNKIDDIRTFYRNDLGWLRNFSVRQ
ncbi:MAG: phenylalanine--tRNA ligase subunit alpha [Candidatus Micrarchaeota archaeon]